MTERIVNLGATTLAAAIPSTSSGSSEVITVTSVPSGASEPVFRVNLGGGELGKVTAVSGTSWTVERGAEGTTPLAHSKGQEVLCVVTNGTFAAYPVGESQLPASVVRSSTNRVPIFAADYTSSGELDLKSAMAKAVEERRSLYLGGGDLTVITYPEPTAGRFAPVYGCGPGSTRLLCNPVNAAAKLSGSLNPEKALTAASLIFGNVVTIASTAGLKAGEKCILCSTEAWAPETEGAASWHGEMVTIKAVLNSGEVELEEILCDTYAARATHTPTATTTEGSTTLSEISAFTGLAPGAKVSGGGIPAGAYIVSVNEGASTAVMSAKATSSNSNEAITVVSGSVLTPMSLAVGAEFKDFTILNTKPTEEGTEGGLDFFYCYRPIVENVETQLLNGPAFRFFSCFEPKSDVAVKESFDEEGNGAIGYLYGYGVQEIGCTTAGQHRITVDKGRHAYTTSGSEQGVPRFSKITGTAQRMTSIAWDTHGGGEHITFHDCMVSQCNYYGYQARAPKTTFFNCRSRGTRQAGVLIRALASECRIIDCDIEDVLTGGADTGVGIRIYGQNTLVQGGRICDTDEEAVNVEEGANNTIITGLTTIRPGRVAHKQHIVARGTSKGHVIVRNQHIGTSAGEPSEYGLNIVGGAVTEYLVDTPVCKWVSTASNVSATVGAAPFATTVTANNAAWPIPAGWKKLTLIVVSGGGGGGGGGSASSAIEQAGGSGGSAGCAAVGVFSVGANTTLNVTVGAGGAGGEGGAAGGKEGKSGINGNISSVTATGIAIEAGRGAHGVGSAANSAAAVSSVVYGAALTGGTGATGAGTGGQSAAPGMAANGYAASGAGGGGKSNTSTKGGGGGEAGGKNVGGAAGAKEASATLTGEVGAEGAANSGAGGGGGGGGAWKKAGEEGAGGNGGKGGSGYVIVIGSE